MVPGLYANVPEAFRPLFSSSLAPASDASIKIH
jgi:hypothetical protein